MNNINLTHDIDNEVVETGDLIIYSCFSTLRKCIVLGNTHCSIKLSTRKCNWRGTGSRVLSHINDIEQHTDVLYVSRYSTNLKIIAKNVTIPKALQKFIK